MNKYALALLVFIAIIMGGIVVHDVISKNRLNIDENKTNWEWSDDWNNTQSPTVIPEQPIKPEEPIEPPDPQQPERQLVVSSFEDALSKAKEYKMPILVLFSAEWCSWCQKMKSQTLTDASVKAMMKNYVFVTVDTDQNKDVAKNFNVGSLPTCLITNEDREKIIQEPGYKSSSEFVKWLNRPDLFKDPSKPQVPPEIQQKPQPRIQPPTPQQPQGG